PARAAHPGDGGAARRILLAPQLPALPPSTGDVFLAAHGGRARDADADLRAHVPGGAALSRAVHLAGAERSVRRSGDARRVPGDAGALLLALVLPGGVLRHLGGPGLPWLHGPATLVRAGAVSDARRGAQATGRAPGRARSTDDGEPRPEKGPRHLRA